MKIIIVSTAFPLRGGIAHFNALLAKHLSERHTVETITFKRQYPSFLFPGKSQEEAGGKTDDNSIHPAPQLIDSINPFNWYIVAREICKRKPGMLIFKFWMPFFGPCFGTIARLVKKHTGAKILFICDNIIPHERRPGDVWFVKYAFGAADYFVVQSKSVEQDLINHFPGSNYRFAPHPVYENFGTAVPKEEARAKLALTAKNVLLFFGYVRQYKGLMNLIESMKIISDSGNQMSDFQLLVVGEFYDDEQKYKQKVNDVNLGENIRFISEYVPNDEVANYFSASDVVVLPYRSATQSGIVQIAYNFDKPVIATDVGGLSEVVLDRRTGYIVPAEDPNALANAILTYFQENRQEEFAQNVREEKKKYSWDNLIQNIESFG